MTALSASKVLPDELCWVSTRVHACVSGFELVYGRTADELQFVLTPDTEGVRLEDLREGQSVVPRFNPFAARRLCEAEDLTQARP